MVLHMNHHLFPFLEPTLAQCVIDVVQRFDCAENAACNSNAEDQPAYIRFTDTSMLQRYLRVLL